MTTATFGVPSEHKVEFYCNSAEGQQRIVKELLKLRNENDTVPRALSHEDWKKLDELLGQLGFGGYYDFKECLRLAITNLNGSERLTGKDDIFILTMVLLELSRQQKAKKQ
jgi:hypothetical protein